MNIHNMKIKQYLNTKRQYLFVPIVHKNPVKCPQLYFISSKTSPVLSTIAPWLKKKMSTEMYFNPPKYFKRRST